ncbi:MAG: PIN domain-containing protein [Opitutales bacterium]
MILDTNAISALADADLALEEKLAAAPRPALPYIAHAEFRYGLLGSTRPEAGLKVLAQLQSILPMLFPDFATLEIYAQLKDQLKKSGHKIPENDLWIAALAQQHDMPILSKDHHFDHVPGIQRIDW